MQSRHLALLILLLISASVIPIVLDEGGSDAISAGSSASPLTTFEHGASEVRSSAQYYHVALGTYLEVTNDSSNIVSGISTGFGIVMNDSKAYGVLSKTGEFHLVIKDVQTSATTDCVISVKDTGSIQSHSNDLVSEAVVGKQYSNMFLFKVDWEGNDIDEIYSVTSNGVKCGDSRYTGSSS